MANVEIDGFVLADTFLTCPYCQLAFHSRVLQSAPSVKPGDKVEADLHRVLPSAEIRAAMLAVCPDCAYCAWTTRFTSYRLKAKLVPAAPSIEPTKKFALAIKWAREERIHALDLAFIALNGLWCARENGEDTELWLKLLADAHEKGIKAFDQPADKDGYSHLVMGEIWRQSGQFDKAINEYRKAQTDPTINKSLINQQTMLAFRKDKEPALLSDDLIAELFPLDELADLPEAQPGLHEAPASAPASALPEKSNEQTTVPATIQKGINIATVAIAEAGAITAAVPISISTGKIIREALPVVAEDEFESTDNSQVLYVAAQAKPLPELEIEDPDQAYLEEEFQSYEGADHAAAISRIESFLSFTRGASNRNWLKGYN